jgi:CHAT domain-containing protein/Flp pilus assembly protein TadD
MMKRLTYLLLIIVSINLSAQDSLYQSALTQFIKAEYTNAYEAFRSVGASYLKERNVNRYALCNIKMAECLIRMDQHKAALELIQRTQSFIESQLEGNPYLLAEAYRVKGESLLNLGKFDESLEALLEAESTYPENALLEKAETFNLLGVSYWNNQNKSLALQYHESALAIRKELQGDESIKVGDSYNNIGLIYLEDQPVQATIYFNRALKIYELQLGTLNPKVAFTMINLARTTSNQGRYQDAEEWVKKVSQIWVELYQQSDHPNKAFTISVRGQIEEGKGNLNEALIYQQAALQQYIRLYEGKHPDIANQYQIIGKLYRKKEDYKEAIHAFQHAIYANLPNQQFISDYDLPEIDTYLHPDYLLSALMDKASTLEALHFDKTLRARELKSAIDTYILADQLLGSIRSYRVQEQDKIRLGATSRQLYESGCKMAIILGEQPFMAKKYYPIVFDFIERSKASVLLQAIQDTKAKSFAGIPEELLITEDSLKNELAYYQQQIAAGENLSENQQKIFEYQTAYRNFTDQLEKDYPKYFELKHGTGYIGADSLQQVIDEQTAIIQYFIGSERLYIFTLTSEEIDISSAEFNTQTQRDITAYRNAIHHKITKMQNQIGTSLYNKLIPSLAEEKSKWVIIPDGILNTIPFEALINEETNSYAIQNASITYSYSATLFHQTLSTEQPSSNEAFLCAPVDFQYTNFQLPALAATKQEISDLSIAFRANGFKATSILEKEAIESEIKNIDLSNYQYLHFATHGEVNQSKPELSRIFLKNDSINDGILYSGELYNLKLAARLVSLSACETGLGKIATGEGIVGLSRALLYAGANNLLVSLWKVSDQATAEIMLQFYETHLIHKEDPFNESLRQAKLSMINSSEFSKPYYWAPFILIGH